MKNIFRPHRGSFLYVSVLSALCSASTMAATFEFDAFGNVPDDSTIFTSSVLGAPVEYRVLTDGSIPSSGVISDFDTSDTLTVTSPEWANVANNTPQSFQTGVISGKIGSLTTVQITAPDFIGPQFALGSLVNSFDGTPNNIQGVLQIRAYVGTPGNYTQIANPNWLVDTNAGTGYEYTTNQNVAGTNGPVNLTSTVLPGGTLEIRNAAVPTGGFSNSTSFTVRSPSLAFDYLELDIDYAGFSPANFGDEVQFAFGADAVPEPSFALLSTLSLGLLLKRRR